MKVAISCCYRLNHEEQIELVMFSGIVVYDGDYIMVYKLEYAGETYHSGGRSVVRKWSKVQFHSTAKHSQTYI